MGWAADRAVEQIAAAGPEPYFGFVSFIGPQPPFAPPLPFNRIYDPDRMPDPVVGDIETDHMDEQIPWMNRIIWASEINDAHARVLKARYYGEITYIDACLGRILDAVEARDLALLLRAGSLAAPIYKVEERTIGPSLGQDNIDQGFRSVMIGLALGWLVYFRRAQIAETFRTYVVAPAEKSLKCTACHTRKDTKRLDWQKLGYEGDPMTVGGRLE